MPISSMFYLQGPPGYRELCLTFPSVCAPGGNSSVRYADVAATLENINSSVNREIAFFPDPQGQDIWTINPARGDCEDYAITKRARLLEMGLPASALLIATAKTEDGGPHAVLVVRTDEGDYVLDSRKVNVMRWDYLRYHWVARTSPKDPKVWQIFEQSAR